MKNISKLLVGILFSALVMAPSYAGELAVLVVRQQLTLQTVMTKLQART